MLRPAFLAAAAFAAAACSSHPVPTLTACVPPGTIALASVDLTRVSLSRLPKSLSSALNNIPGATQLLLAYTGNGFLLIAGGQFSAAPAGGKLLNSRIALAGSPDLIQAAEAQYRTGRAGAPDLLAAGPKQPVWAVIRGNATLPLPGNAANLNRLIHLTEFTTIGADWNATVHVEAVGHCRSPEDALQIEETVRAAATLAHATVQIEREDTTVRVQYTGTAEALDKFFR